MSLPVLRGQPYHLSVKGIQPYPTAVRRACVSTRRHPDHPARRSTPYRADRTTDTIAMRCVPYRIGSQCKPYHTIPRSARLSQQPAGRIGRRMTGRGRMSTGWRCAVPDHSQNFCSKSKLDIANGSKETTYKEDCDNSEGVLRFLRVSNINSISTSLR